MCMEYGVLLHTVATFTRTRQFGAAAGATTSGKLAQTGVTGEAALGLMAVMAIAEGATCSSRRAASTSTAGNPNIAAPRSGPPPDSSPGGQLRGVVVSLLFFFRAVLLDPFGQHPTHRHPAAHAFHLKPLMDVRLYGERRMNQAFLVVILCECQCTCQSFRCAVLCF